MKAYRCDGCGAVHNTDKPNIVLHTERLTPSFGSLMRVMSLPEERHFDDWRCVVKYAHERQVAEEERARTQEGDRG